jgi:hypothetical protein
MLAFYAMKTALIDAVILNYPNSVDTFILDTDASNNTIGAELSQIQQGKEKPISFASKVLSSAQRKYCTTRKELLAIVVFVILDIPAFPCSFLDLCCMAMLYCANSSSHLAS